VTTPSDPLFADPAALGMQRHPEGGWYREIWRHPAMHRSAYGERSLATCVSFLLLPGQRSAWHRVRSEELWLWHGGGPVRVTAGGAGPQPAPGPADTTELGPGDYRLIPPNVWQTAEPALDRPTLVACVVSPGFDFADLEMLRQTAAG
jgi:predicted cupin superfamily sugar epimerase